MTDLDAEASPEAGSADTGAGRDSALSGDDRDHVVTAFLRNRGEILLCRRSDAVGTYSGTWGGVSGFAEGDPDEQIRAEIREETGLDADAVSLVRTGRPLQVTDPDLDREWVVHPYLFDAASRDVELSEEHTEATWLPPTSIVADDRGTVPQLWEAYERVAPTVRSIAADDEHGAAFLSIRALEVLRDRAGLLIREREDGTIDHADEWDELAALARRLLEVRPSMAVLRNRVNRAMADAATVGTSDGDAPDSPDAEAVLASTIEGIDRAVAADGEAADRASEFASGRVLTLSRSATVLAAIRSGDPDRVFVAESRPGSEGERQRALGDANGERRRPVSGGDDRQRALGDTNEKRRRPVSGEGVAVAESLSEELPVTLCTDAAVAHVLATEAIDAVLVGADTILPDGRVVNKTGTRAAALAADAVDVPVYAVAASEKISTRESVNLESGDRAAIYDGDAPLDVVNPTFDVTPAAAVSGIVTERGVLDADGVEAVARTLREHEGWDDPSE